MPKITITAAKGEKLNVAINKLYVIERPVDEVRDPAGNVLAPARVDKFSGFEVIDNVSFASETREFVIEVNQTLTVTPVKVV